MGGGQSTEEGVSNHPAARAVSDQLDATLFRGGYQNESGTRAVVHGVYHEGVAIQNKMAGNDRGYDAERTRAKEQWHVLGAAVQRHNDRLTELNDCVDRYGVRDS